MGKLSDLHEIVGSRISDYNSATSATPEGVSHTEPLPSMGQTLIELRQYRRVLEHMLNYHGITMHAMYAWSLGLLVQSSGDESEYKSHRSEVVWRKGLRQPRRLVASTQPCLRWCDRSFTRYLLVNSHIAQGRARLRTNNNRAAAAA